MKKSQLQLHTQTNHSLFFPPVNQTAPIGFSLPQAANAEQKAIYKPSIMKFTLRDSK